MLPDLHACCVSCTPPAWSGARHESYEHAAYKGLQCDPLTPTTPPVTHCLSQGSLCWPPVTPQRCLRHSCRAHSMG
jgi:hypothetical protein